MAIRRFYSKYARKYKSRSAKYLARRKKTTRMYSKLRRRYGIKRGRTRKTPRIRVSAPSTVTASTYYSDKMWPKMKILQKKFAKSSTNLYTYTDGVQLVSQSGAQNAVTRTIMGGGFMRNALAAIGEQPANTAGSLQDTNRIFWKMAEQFTTFTNSGNATAFVDIYQLSVRRATNNNPQTLWQSGIQDQASSAFQSITALGLTPGMSQAFTDYYKMKKVYTICLAPGQSHQHNAKYPIFQLINNSVIATDMQGDNFLPGVSRAQLFVGRGAPVTDGTTSSNVNTAPVKINMACTQRCTFTYLSDNDANLLLSAGTGLGAVGGNTNVMNVIGAPSAANQSYIGTTV